MAVVTALNQRRRPVLTDIHSTETYSPGRRELLLVGEEE